MQQGLASFHPAFFQRGFRLFGVAQLELCHPQVEPSLVVKDAFGIRNGLLQVRSGFDGISMGKVRGTNKKMKPVFFLLLLHQIGMASRRDRVLTWSSPVRVPKTASTTTLVSH